MRQTPLIVVASANAGTADSVADWLRRSGSIAYATHSVQGCLRVATSVGPDIVVLDPALPKRLVELLRAHPVSAQATVMGLSDVGGLAFSTAEPARAPQLSAA